MKTCLIGFALVLSIATVGLISVTSFTNDFVSASVNENCVVAHVGAFNSEWDSTCMGEGSLADPFTSPTTEFWPLFPLQNANVSGNPLQALNLPEFETCNDTLNAFKGAVDAQLAGLEGLLKVATLSPPLITSLDQVTGVPHPLNPTVIVPFEIIFNSTAVISNTLKGLLGGLPPALQGQLTPQSVGGAVTVLGECFCSQELEQVKLTLLVNGAPAEIPFDVCPEGIETTTGTLKKLYGGEVDSLGQCLEAYARKSTVEGLNTAFASPADKPLLTDEQFLKACEDDNIDIEKITQAQTLLYVSVGLAGAAALSGVICLATGGNIVVTVITALLSAAASGITAYALLTVQSAPIYEKVGEEGCVVCYENSTNFYTGIASILAPGVAFLVYIASVFVSGSDDDDEETLELVGEKA